MIDLKLHELLERVAVQLDRLASAMEKTNALSEKIMKCPGCMGDGKAYGSGRCMRCGGTGVKQ
jgi:DnaJ-class molecular chaperone